MHLLLIFMQHIQAFRGKGLKGLIILGWLCQLQCQVCNRRDEGERRGGGRNGYHTIAVIATPLYRKSVVGRRYFQGKTHKQTSKQTLQQTNQPYGIRQDKQHLQQRQQQQRLLLLLLLFINGLLHKERETSNPISKRIDELSKTYTKG